MTDRITWCLGVALVVIALFAEPLGRAVSAVGGAVAAVGTVVIIVAFLASPLIDLMLLASASKNRQPPK